MSRVLKLLLVVFLLTPLLFPGSAFACSCVPLGSPSESVLLYDEVFSGVVESVVAPPNIGDFGEIAVSFDVQRVWKGEVGKRIGIATPNQSSACGYNFEKGQKYFVYAKKEESGKYSVSLCSPTKRLVDATDDIAQLGSGELIKDEETAPNTLQNNLFAIYGVLLTSASTLMSLRQPNKGKR